MSLKKVIKPAEWTSEMSVEEPVIDSQHKKLFAIFNELIKEVGSDERVALLRTTIHALDDYVRQHFSYEEEYMLMLNFPDYQKHKTIHKKLISYLDNFKVKLDRVLYENKQQVLVSEKLAGLIIDCRNYLANWLKEHIFGADQKYHSYAVKKGFIGKKLADWLKKPTFDTDKKSISPVMKKVVISKKLANLKKIVKNKPSAIKNKGKINHSKNSPIISDKLIQEQRKLIVGLMKKELKPKNRGVKDYVFTGISGFDSLFEKGIPAGNSIIIAGGAGSGKTIFSLQTLINKAREGKKCLYMTLEEDENKLVEHMEDFGWNAEELIKKGKLKIFRMNPFDITRNVDALLAKQKGELLIDIAPMIMPPDFENPDFIVVDSLTAIASAFTGKDDSYRIYIEQFFRFLQKTGATSFLITETEQVPKIFSQSGVEEFLADGVVVLYAIKHGNVRENAIEVLKLRGAAHSKKIVAMQINSKGIVIYPEQEVFS